jgi:trigger factor
LEAEMQAQVDRVSPVLVEIKVEVPWSKVNEHLEQAYRTLQRTAKVRGFRPGKVPRSVVKGMMSKSIEQDVQNRIVEEQLGEVVKEHKLEAIAMTSMDAKGGIAEGNPFAFTAKLEVRPTIDKVDTSELKVERTVDAVSEQAVDNEIARLREQNAELRAPESPRPAKDGDVLALNIEVSVDGEPRADLSSTNTRAELGAKRLLEPLEQGLQGVSNGETREVSMTFPDDYGHEPLRSKPAVFKITVTDIQEKILPEIDDDFARDLEHESVAAMKAKIRGDLESTAKRKSDAMVREAVVEKLIDTNPVPVPPSLVERQQRQMIGELMRFQQQFGDQMPFGDELFSGLRERAERKVRAGLLFGAVATQQSLEVTQADVEGELSKIAAQSGKHIAKVRVEYAGERGDGLRMQILENKLLEYLISQATITDAAPKPAEGDAS